VAISFVHNGRGLGSLSVLDAKQEGVRAHDKSLRLVAFAEDVIASGLDFVWMN
jgi:hypothetical protein